MRAWIVALVFIGVVSALTVTSTAPSDGFLAPSLSQSFSFTVDANVSSCALYTNQSGWTAVQNQSSAASLNHSFSADGSYLWSVSCSDGNNTAFSSNRSLRIDSTAPTPVSNLAASGTSTVNVSWSASADASAITYQVFRNATSVANASGLFFSEGVAAGQSYNYSVKAVDAAGNAAPAVGVLFHAPASNVTISSLTISSTSSTATFSWANAPAANASVSFGNQTTVLGIVSNPALVTNPSLSLAGLLPASTYFYNVTACVSTCAQVTGSFSTKPSSFPSPSQIQHVNNTASQPALFSAFWTDSLNLSHYIFSTNLSGAWVNTTYAFNGSYSNHSMILPGTATNLYWQFFANNSQNAFNQTPIQNLTVQVPGPTPSPTASPVLDPASTPFPTIPPNLVKATPTPSVEPTPTPVPVEEPVAAQATATPPLNFSGLLADLVVNAADAVFGLSPEGLLVELNSSNASVSFSSLFNNTGSGVTVVLTSELTGDSGVFQLKSDPVTVRSGQAVILQTRPHVVPSGVYDVKAEVVNLEAGSVLSTSQKLRVHVKTPAEQGTLTALFSGQSAPAAFGGLALVLGIGLFLVAQLASLKKEFNQ